MLPAASRLGAGVVCGVAWQWVYRRDLADRWIFFTACTAAAAFCLLLPVAWQVENNSLLALLGLVAGLVCMEQAMRLRDIRSRSRARSHQDVPARP